MARPKGSPKLGGRQKGTPNKLSAKVKEGFLLAYKACGGDKAFGDWAKANQTEFYKLYSKLLPTDVTSGEEPIQHTTQVILPRATGGQNV